MKQKHKISLIAAVVIVVCLLAYLLLYMRHGTIGEVYDTFFSQYEIDDIDFYNDSYRYAGLPGDFETREGCLDAARNEICALEITSAIPFLYEKWSSIEQIIWLSGYNSDGDYGAMIIRILDEKTVAIQLHSTTIPQLSKTQVYRLSRSLQLDDILRNFEVDLEAWEDYADWYTD